MHCQLLWGIQDEWRKFVSPTCPGPRSAHATVSSPAGGGKLFLFGVYRLSIGISPLMSCVLGGEFSSLYQNSFHHYRDFWCFDVTTRMWDRVETKIKPSARSGHRYHPSAPVYSNNTNLTPILGWQCGSITYSCLAGFMIQAYGVREVASVTVFNAKPPIANYLNDLWYFDTQEYVWRQVEFKENERKPSYVMGLLPHPTVLNPFSSPRSGFSFLPTTDGIVLHGRCGVYTPVRDICLRYSFFKAGTAKSIRKGNVLSVSCWKTHGF